MQRAVIADEANEFNVLQKLHFDIKKLFTVTLCGQRNEIDMNHVMFLKSMTYEID